MLTEDECEVYEEAGGLPRLGQVGEEGDQAEHQHRAVRPDVPQRGERVNLHMEIRDRDW